jgi:hypothetical protein
MGRDVTADNTPLLKNAEQNIGNSIELQPQAGKLGTVTPQPSSQRIIQLTGGSAVGQTTSIVLTATRIIGPQNPVPGFAGPITGIIEFGNGGRSTRAEIDIPFGPFAGYINSVQNAVDPQDGGVIVSVPTGVLRVYARYDNLLLQPLLNEQSPPFPAPFTPISFAQQQGLLVAGPGSFFPGTHPAGTPPFPAEPVLIKAMAAYFSRHFARAYKTQYCFISADGSTHPVAAAPAFTAPYTYVIPAFARTLRVLRAPISASLVVSLIDGNFNQFDQITIPGGSSPTIPIVGHEIAVQLLSATNTGADNVSFLALCYEIGI